MISALSSADAAVEDVPLAAASFSSNPQQQQQLRSISHTSSEAASHGTLNSSDHFMGTKLDISRFSDYTEPTSNIHHHARTGSPPLRVVSMQQQQQQQTRGTLPPPGSLNDLQTNEQQQPEQDVGTTGEMTPPRRNIFGVVVESKYQTTTDFSHVHPATEGLPVESAVVAVATEPTAEPTSNNLLATTEPPLQQQLPAAPTETLENDNSAAAVQSNKDNVVEATANDEVPSGLQMPVAEESGVLVIESPAIRPGLTRDGISELTLPGEWLGNTNNNRRNSKKLFQAVSKNHSNGSKSRDQDQHHHHKKSRHSPRPHETIHAQSLLLGLAFCAVWSPSNLMAPNLTEMADFFSFDEYQRDLYLGSYCALATGVFSFPIGAGIGILADMVNRKYLFCLTLVGGAASAWATGKATNFPQLFLCRLLNGGFMSGAVPVVFSLLGDLFAVEERNAASSGFTAMMGLGIILGQVYAGVKGPELGWQHAFGVSAMVTLVLAAICLVMVQEPVRGGKERVLQDMIKSGTRYERKLTLQGFMKACLQNASNSILLWQGFFSSLPWGIIFVFLNDYLSQERGFSVPAATYLVFLFGMGCAVGGVLGGYWGQVVQGMNRRYLPLFMALTTELGILPFLGMLNVRIPRAHGTLGILFSFGSGVIASLPSVNVRPCLINVNPPETRGAALTAANLLINLGRGIGPSCVTLLGMYFSRQDALNLTLTVFWTISAIQLVMLSKTLPRDQDTMEAELAHYANSQIKKSANGNSLEIPPASSEASKTEHVMSPTAVVLLTENSEQSPILLNDPLTDQFHDGDESVEVSIEDRMTSFDGVAARQTLIYVQQGMREFKQELVDAMPHCGCEMISESSSDDFDEGIISDDDDEESAKDKATENKSSLLYKGMPPPIQSFSDASELPAEPSERTPLIV